MLNEPLPERVKKMEVTEQGIRFNSEDHRCPTNRSSGRSASAPRSRRCHSLQPDYWGGNMDLPDVGPGAIVYFPVLHHEDAYLYLGDCHATQGDGELCGVAVEMASTTTIQVDLIKDWTIALAAARERALHHDDRLRAADGGRGAHRLSRADPLAGRRLRLGRDEAYFFLTQAGRVRLGNMVDPKYTLGARS